MLLNLCLVVAAGAYIVRRAVIAARGDTTTPLYIRERLTVLSSMPPREGVTVFLGDSLTDRGEWAEMFGYQPIQNRGIGGDTTEGVLRRAPALAVQKPSRVFLLIGINDLGKGEGVPAIAERYAAILEVLRAAAPAAKLYCQSVFPVRQELAPPAMTNAKIRALNEAIARVAAERSCTYIDLFSVLADEDGALAPQYTIDGLHLTGEGYAAWVRAIAPWMNAR